MKGNYKIGIAVLLLVTITAASAATQIGDNITVANNVTAQNFIGNLNWAYLLGIPTDFPNSTAVTANNTANGAVQTSLYNGDFPNTSLPNYLLISTYGTDFPNLTAVTANNTANGAVQTSLYNGDFPNTSLPNYLLISTYGTDFPNSTAVTANNTANGAVQTSLYNGNFPNTSLPNYLLISTYGTDFPNSTAVTANNTANGAVQTSLYNGNFPNSSVLTKEPAITGSTSNTFWNGLKQFVTLSSGLITDFSAAVRTNISATGNATYNSATGVIDALTNITAVRTSISATGNATYNSSTGVIDALTNITAVRNSISSSSGLVSYNSSTGVVSDSINSSANLYNINGSNVTSGKVNSQFLNITNITSYLSSNKVTPNNNVYVVGPTINLQAGTWFLNGGVTVSEVGGAGSLKVVTCNMSQGGTNVISSGEAASNAVPAVIQLSGLISLSSPATAQIACAGGAQNATIYAAVPDNAGGAGNTASYITALRIG